MTNHMQHLSDDMLNAWIDGSTTADERDIIQTHIATCDACAESLRELTLLKAMLGSLRDSEPVPHSFRLTADQANQPTPLRTPARPSNVVSFEPILRVLSIAAVLAVLVLGGFQAFGTDEGFLGLNDQQISQDTETAAPSRASDESSQANGVTDQGDSAENSTGVGNVIGSPAPDAPASTDDGMSPLTIATISVGALAVILSLAWLWMSAQSGVNR